MRLFPIISETENKIAILWGVNMSVQLFLRFIVNWDSYSSLEIIALNQFMHIKIISILTLSIVSKRRICPLWTLFAWSCLPFPAHPGQDLARITSSAFESASPFVWAFHHGLTAPIIYDHEDFGYSRMFLGGVIDDSYLRWTKVTDRFGLWACNRRPKKWKFMH